MIATILYYLVGGGSILLAGNTAPHTNSNVHEKERVLGTRTIRSVVEPYVCVDLWGRLISYVRRRE